MTFEEILDQAIAMLQQRGRLTYGTLKRQFQLDDGYLEDLKAELIEGQRVAVDEEGRVLVWTGGADVPQLRPSPPTADVQLTQGHPLPTAPPPPDALYKTVSAVLARVGLLPAVRRLGRNLLEGPYKRRPPVTWMSRAIRRRVKPDDDL